MDFLQAHPFKGYIDKTECRGITAPQLQVVFEYATEKCCNWHDSAPKEFSATSGQRLDMDILNLYHLCFWLIKPATALDDCALVELFTAEEQVPTWLVSHWWGERIRDFVACISQHVIVRQAADDVAYWVCAYANRQHSISQELSEDVTQTSFFKSMVRARGIVLVLDEETVASGPATPFSRVWCAFEIYVATVDMPELVLDIATTTDGKAHFLTETPTKSDHRLGPSCAPELKALREQHFPLGVVKPGMHFCIQNAKATVESDRAHILNWIAGRRPWLEPLSHHVKYARLNRSLAGFFATAIWPQAVDKPRLVEELGLVDILAADTERKQLNMFFSSSSFTDDDAKILAKGFPPVLEALRLTFFSKEISSESVCALAAKMPATLKVVVLKFRDTKCMIGDRALAALGESLPPGLEELSLKCNAGSDIGDAGVAALAAGLRASLRSLNLQFNYTKVGNAGLAALARNLPKSVKHLFLYLAGTAVGDSGIAALADRLPQSAEVLDLSFSNCDDGAVTDASVAALAIGLPSSLKNVKLSVCDSYKVSDAGVAALAAKLPSTLQSLDARFFGCVRLTAAGVKALACQIPDASRILLDLRPSADSDMYFDSLEVLRAWQLSAERLDLPDAAVLPSDLEIAEPAQPFCEKRLVREKLKELFYDADENHNGMMSAAEFVRCMKGLNSRMTRSQCLRLFRHAEKNKSDRMSVGEFCDFLFARPECRLVAEVD
eukprot:TRINITY_DN73964_c0_g1_i1.p1 TRINITY_DN73964_c0_g1~~TRINITY_DN73964_c0_g1_i1.p1  ORF type:complete len:725 (+),score=125.75 TRINITY_DN73964_c0_g1_i1:38-2212(+)